MKRHGLWVLVLTGCAAFSAIAQTASANIAEVDARAEVSAALYAASATQAASERVADAKLRTQRKEIEALRITVRSGDARRKAELSAAVATKLDRMQRGDLESRLSVQYDDKHLWFAWPAFLLLALGAGLGEGPLRRRRA